MANSATRDLSLERSELPSDHVLLQRAQETLKTQLLDIKQDLGERLHERQKALKDVKTLRQQHGVELYGFQERLVSLHKKLEASQAQTRVSNTKRQKAEAALECSRTDFDTLKETATKQRTEAEKRQSELDQLNTTVKQIEAYNEETRNVMLVTQRETTATESISRELEQAKQKQDHLIIDLERNLKRLREEHETLDSQLKAQLAEKQTANDVLQEAQRDMENVHFERKQLVSVWKSSLVHLQQKDMALSSVEQRLQQQIQRESEIDTEKIALHNQLEKEHDKRDQQETVAMKIRSDSEQASDLIAASVAKRGALQQQLQEAEDSVNRINTQLEETETEGKEIHYASEVCRKRYVEISKETQELHDTVLTAMHERSTTEKSADKAIGEIRKKTTEKQNLDLQAIELRNEISKLQVDILNTECHNVQLKDSVAMIEKALEEHLATIRQLEAESGKRTDDIDKQTRELDGLNRRYLDLSESMEDEGLGPLEAKIHSLQCEILKKGTESQDVQRQWLQVQLEFVSSENHNTKLNETLSILHAKTSVMRQKKNRFEAVLQQNLSALKAMRSRMDQLHRDIQSLNSVIAKNSDLASLLENQTFGIEQDIAAKLKEMEIETRQIECTIRQTTEEKRDLLSEIVQTERRIMIWERKIELEKEMQAALEPDLGQENRLQSLRRDIHRMELNRAELLRSQESLIREMEVAIKKRQNIRYKSEALSTRESTGSQLEVVCQDIRRNIVALRKETDATRERICRLQNQRAELLVDVDLSRKETQQRQIQVQDIDAKLLDVRTQKVAALMKTLVFQRISKRLEDAQQGTCRLLLPKPEALPAELEKAQAKSATIRGSFTHKRQQSQSESFLAGLAQLDALDVIYL